MISALGTGIIAACCAGVAVQIAIEIPGVKLGVVEAEGLRVELVVPDLAREMDAVCDRLRGQLTVEKVAELDSIRDVRAMFRGWGVDPSKYRPSAEALLRRVAQGKGLYRLSSVVDIINLCSVETGWPYGCYDAHRIKPPAVMRLGRPGETYERIGRAMWHLEGRPVLSDAEGPFGSPTSDSTRTMITEATTALVTTIFAPPRSPDAAVHRAMEQHAARLERFCGACITRQEVLPPL